MCATFLDEDVGKRVENADGDPIGTITDVEGDAARVDPSPGVVDSIKAALGWERAPEEAVSIDESAVDEVTDDAIRLEADPVESDRPSDPLSDEPAGSSESDDGAEPALEPELEPEEIRDRADEGASPTSGAETDSIEPDDSHGLERATDGTSVTDGADAHRRIEDGPDGNRRTDDSSGEEGENRRTGAEPREEDPGHGDEHVEDAETTASGGNDPAAEVNPGVDALEDAGRSAESAETGPAADAEERDPADEIDLGVDADALENAAESDAAGSDATGSAIGGGNATEGTDPTEALDRGADLESVAATDREGSVESTGTGPDEGRIDDETRPRTPADRIEESSDDARAEGTDGTRDEASDGARRSGFPVRALFAPQRAAIEGGRRAFEGGLAVQRRTALNVLEGQQAMQRRQREAVRTATRAAFGVVADAGESTVADDGESDRQDRRNADADESNRGG